MICAAVPAIRLVSLPLGVWSVSSSVMTVQIMLQMSRSSTERELNELGRGFPDGFDMCSMIWFVITDGPMDQTPAGKVTNLLAGSAQQIEDILKRYKEAGMTMPLLWPPFRDVPTSKTIDDIKRLVEEIMPKVNAA